MKKQLLICAAMIFVIVPVLADEAGREKAVQVEQITRFAPLHVYIDSGGELLAAYQFELSAVVGKVKIVGVEGGEEKAFKEAPYYDPGALSRDRIIIAAFSTGKDLPKGRVRVATIHLQIIGDIEPEYKANLTVAGSVDGKEIPAEITLKQGEQK